MTGAPLGGRIAARSWLSRHRWLLLRRASQFGFLALFLAGPVSGVWIVKGSLASSLTLGLLPLTDPYVLLQSLVAGHALGVTSLLGAAIVLVVYALIGGRIYCSFMCPVNVVTDAANWLRDRLALSKGWQPRRETRLWLLGATLVVSAVTGTVAWEFINPVTLLYRGLLFGIGFAWTVVLAVFLLDLFISRRGWCGHLCPVGAFYGLVGSFALVRLSAKGRDNCDDCMDCFAVCPEPHVITPALRGAGSMILSRDCSNCGRCIDVCDRGVFAFGFRFNNRMSAANRHNAGAAGKSAHRHAA